MEATVSECDFHNLQTVEWGYGEGDSALTCETALPEAVTIKCDHVAWSSGETRHTGSQTGMGGRDRGSGAWYMQQVFCVFS